MNVATYERLTLSAPLNDRTAIYALAPELSEKCFGYGPGDEPSVAHKLIYRAMLALYQDQKPIDVATVTQRLGKDLAHVGGEAYLATVSQTMALLGIGDTRGLQQWAQVVDNAGRLRQLSTVLTDYSDKLEDIDKAVTRIQDVDAFFTDLFEKIGATSKAQTTYKPIAQAAGEFRRYLDAEQGGVAVSWLPVGWESTKRYRLLPRSALVTIMGLSSIGKSQLLAQFLLGAAIQLKANDMTGVCLLNTYEMKGRVYVGRMASCLSGIDLLSPQLKDSSTTEYKQLMEATEFVESLPIMWDEGDMTSRQIITQALALSAEMGGVHVVGVDYVELSPDKGPSEEQRVAGVYRNTQSLSRKLDACVIDLSQISGEAFSNETRIALPWNTRYSKAGWHACDIQIEIYNCIQMKKQGIKFRVPDYLPGDNYAYGLVKKNKNGPTGWFKLGWEPEIVRFSDPELAGFGMSKLYENLDQVWSDF